MKYIRSVFKCVDLPLCCDVGNTVVFVSEPDTLNPIGFFRAMPPGN